MCVSHDQKVWSQSLCMEYSVHGIQLSLRGVTRLLAQAEGRGSQGEGGAGLYVAILVGL